VTDTPTDTAAERTRLLAQRDALRVRIEARLAESGRRSA